MTAKLHTTALSANGRKPLAVALHLQAPVDIVEVNVYRGEGRRKGFRTVNPLGQIPVLEEEGWRLTESNAIALYLAQLDPTAILLPASPRERAEVHQWMSWEAAQFQPALTAALRPAVAHRVLPEAVPAPEEPPRWRAPELVRQLDFLQEHLRGRSFLVSDEASVADYCVAGMTTYFRACAFPLQSYPPIAQWLARVEGLPGWQRSRCSLWT